MESQMQRHDISYSHFRDGNTVIQGDVHLHHAQLAQTNAFVTRQPHRDGLPIYHIPFPQNKNFTGREASLDLLKKRLFLERDCQVLALAGLGGIGKTQIALQLAYWVKDIYPKHSVFWVPLLSYASFEQAYNEIARQLCISTNSKGEDLSEAVRRHLSSAAAGHWIMIVDNADDHALLLQSSDQRRVYDYLPHNENGVVLFTTRSEEVATAIAGSDVLELQSMDVDEAYSMFEKSLRRKHLVHDRAITHELLEELTYLPLAIAHTAAYLNRNKQVSLVKYLQLLRGTEHEAASLLSRGFSDMTRYETSQNAVAKTWLVSFEQIRQNDAVAAKLLFYISYVESRAIPHKILPRDTDEELEHAIGTLCGYAFLSQRDDSEVFDMHRLVHLAARIWTRDGSETTRTKGAMLTHFGAIFPRASHENRLIWRAYMPHALRLLRDSDEIQTGQRCDLLFRAGRCLHYDRRTKEAITFLEEVFIWRKSFLAEDDRLRLASQHQLAKAYIIGRRFKEAVILLEHVVEVDKEILAEDNESRLSSEHELARAYLKDGRVKEAIGMLEHVVEVEKQILSEDDGSRLTSQHELASAYINVGRLKEATAMLEHVVGVRRKSLAEDDKHRLTSEHELSRAYIEDGRVKEAIGMLEHVVEVEKEILAEDNIDRLASERELASGYIEYGRVKDAIVMLEHVVGLMKTFAEDDHSRLRSEHELAKAYLKDGRVQEAIAMLEHVVDMTKTLAEDDPSRLRSEKLLATCVKEA
jgi:tetratricopeptide (TPR) repeat protein